MGRVCKCGSGRSNGCKRQKRQGTRGNTAVELRLARCETRLQEMLGALRELVKSLERGGRACG